MLSYIALRSNYAIILGRMKTKVQDKSLRKKLSIIVFVISAIIVLAIGWFYFQSRISYPLGDKLEYVGKQDYGCTWLCDSRPSTSYFYATDLTPPELAIYLQNAQATDAEFQIGRWQNRGESFHIDFINQTSSERFTLYFYTDPPKIGTESIQTTKQYIVSLNSGSYKIVLDAL